MSNVCPIIFGFSGCELTQEEKSFFKKANPLGYILFARNLKTPTQVRTLISELKDIAGREKVPILIDQEGGRVSRLPFGLHFPSAYSFGQQYDQDQERALEACFKNYQAIAELLTDLTITVNCAPVLDLLLPETTNAIGDRAFGEDPKKVSQLGRAALDGLRKGGIVPVMKHIPGYGPTRQDAHFVLDVVNLDEDNLKPHFYPFQDQTSLPIWGMSAHVLYTAFDPHDPVTLSSTMVQTVIRGTINFKGFLISDDLCMKSLAGSPDQKVAKSLAAGMDAVLYCHGDLDEKNQALQGAKTLSNESLERLKHNGF